MASIAARPHPGRLPKKLRREQLLSVALDVFVEQGYHAASMDEIASRAGVSKPVVYQHFPGKRELYLALLDSSVDTLLAGVREALASTSDNRRRVEAVTDLWYRYAADRRAAFRLVSESDLTNDAEVKAHLDRFSGETAGAIAEVIREDTGLPQEAAHLLAASLVGIGHHGSRTWLDSGMAKDDAVRLAVRLAWRGIGGFPKDEKE